MTSFLLYIATKSFEDYFKAIAFLSYTYVILAATILKYVMVKAKPELYTELKLYFQLSFFLFIPISLTLIGIGFKKETSLNGSFVGLKWPYWTCLLSVILIHILLAIGFTYTLIQ